MKNIIAHLRERPLLYPPLIRSQLDNNQPLLRSLLQTLRTQRLSSQIHSVILSKPVTSSPISRQLFLQTLKQCQNFQNIQVQSVLYNLRELTFADCQLQSLAGQIPEQDENVLEIELQRAFQKFMEKMILPNLNLQINLQICIGKIAKYFRKNHVRWTQHVKEELLQRTTRLAIHQTLQTVCILTFFDNLPADFFYTNVSKWTQYATSIQSLIKMSDKPIILLSQILSRQRLPYLLLKQKELLIYLLRYIEHFTHSQVIRTLYYVSNFQVQHSDLYFQLLKRAFIEPIKPHQAKLILISMNNLKRRGVGEEPRLRETALRLQSVVEDLYYKKMIKYF